MPNVNEIYCLDSNILIQPWQKYYSPKYCPSYWTTLNELGKKGRIFVPREVYDEINKTDDDLLVWLKSSNISIHETSLVVIDCLKNIYATDENHKRLVDSIKGRSLADPWVIAHAMASKATVVTKEGFVSDPSTKRIRIPNVCENMNIRWINDFQMVEELGISFQCNL